MVLALLIDQRTELFRAVDSIERKDEKLIGLAACSTPRGSRLGGEGERMRR